MPKVFELLGFIFFFYSNERGEPPHVHVRRQGAEAKLWLKDSVIARNRGFADQNLPKSGCWLRLIVVSLGERGDIILAIDTRDVVMESVLVTETHVVAKLSDGREIATPLSWYPSLEKALPVQRRHFTMSPFGVHWPDLDEDIGLDGMLMGYKSPLSQVFHSSSSLDPIDGHAGFRSHLNRPLRRQRAEGA